MPFPKVPDCRSQLPETRDLILSWLEYTKKKKDEIEQEKRRMTDCQSKGRKGMEEVAKIY